MGNLFKKPAPAPVSTYVPPEPGKWVEEFGQNGAELGTYRWEGPEPPGGRPENPANTPEGKANSERIVKERIAHEAYIDKITGRRPVGGRRKRTKKAKKGGRKRRLRRLRTRRHSS
jgi:hypothetical protein